MKKSLILLVAIALQSCIARFDSQITRKEYFEFAIENDIPLDKIRYVKKDVYVSLVNRNTLDSHQHVMLQPLQTIYFRNNDLISFNCNCIAGGWGNGLIKITWNRSGMYNVFPPLDNDWFKIQTKINPDSIFNNSIPLLNVDDNKEKQKYTNKEYVIFVFWGLFLENRAENLISQVHENLKLSDTSKYEVYYIIDDEFFYYTIIN